MSFVASYGCTSAAGEGVEALWNAARAGRDLSAPVSTSGWPVSLTFEPRACLWPDHGTTGSVSEEQLLQLRRAWRETREKLPAPLRNFGVVFASTKGSIEDLVWKSEAVPSQDPIGSLMRAFLAENELTPRISMAISNACSSSLSALGLAETWLSAELVDTVVVVAVDFIGPFVLQGFHSLHALSQTKVRPFSKERDGLQLGEAAVCLVLTRETSALRFEGAAIDAEGYAVTRPSPSGASLERAIRSLRLAGEPELIIGHGTGTTLNDETEDRVFHGLFPNVPITASKWCVGHTLGASGLVDSVLACETIRRGEAFAIAATEMADPAFQARYLTRDADVAVAPKRVLVTSLGFGGIHAAAAFAKGPA